MAITRIRPDTTAVAGVAVSLDDDTFNSKFDADVLACRPESVHRLRRLVENTARVNSRGQGALLSPSRSIVPPAGARTNNRAHGEIGSVP